VAEFLISRFRDIDEKINDLSVSMFNIVSEKVKNENDRLYKLMLVIKPAVKERLSANSGNLRFLGIGLSGSVKQLLIKKTGLLNRQNDRLRTVTKGYISNRKHGLEMLEKKNGYLDPFLILKRGYSVTYYNGKALINPTVVQSEEIIETKLAEGILKSKTL
jgi:exodeoxyribonuclease VII large subunit